MVLDLLVREVPSTSAKDVRVLGFRVISRTIVAEIWSLELPANLSELACSKGVPGRARFQGIQVADSFDEHLIIANLNFSSEVDSKSTLAESVAFSHQSLTKIGSLAATSNAPIEERLKPEFDNVGEIFDPVLMRLDQLEETVRRFNHSGASCNHLISSLKDRIALAKAMAHFRRGVVSCNDVIASTFE